jgi:thymidylate synthase (FAD)
MENQEIPSTQPSNNIERSIDPLKDGISSLELVRVSGSDVDVVNAARVSYGKFVTKISENDRKLIRFLIEHKHTSPFEHNQFSFRVKAPIFVARQWMRHRINSYNEISYRYVQAPLEFYIPPKWRYQDTVNKQASVGSFENEELMRTYKNGLEACVKTYETLLANGVCRELARGILPVCTYTQFIYTCNLQALTHFLKLRLHPGAQYEIRNFAQGLLALALPHFPISLGEWRKSNAGHLDLDGFDTFTAAFTNALE